MSQPSPDQVVSSLRAFKEAEASAVQRGTGKIMDIAIIAARAVYTAASNGNVCCKEAVKEIEKLRLEHERRNPQDRRILRPAPKPENTSSHGANASVAVEAES